MQEQYFALLRHKLSQRGGDPGSSKGGAEAVVAQRRVLAKLDINGKAGIELELVLLRPPVVTKKVRGDAEQPRPHASLLGVKVMAPSVGDRERLSGQIVGEGSAHPTSDETMNYREVVLEASLKRPTISDQPIAGLPPVQWPSALHTYVLSPASISFPCQVKIPPRPESSTPVVRTQIGLGCFEQLAGPSRVAAPQPVHAFPQLRKV